MWCQNAQAALNRAGLCSGQVGSGMSCPNAASAGSEFPNLSGACAAAAETQQTAAMFASQYAPLEIVLLKPERIEEMEQAVQLLQRHSTVVVDMALLDNSNAQRFIDFLSGAVWSLDGSIQRVSDEVIVAAPMAIRLTSALEAEPEI